MLENGTWRGIAFIAIDFRRENDVFNAIFTLDFSVWTIRK